MNGRDSTPLYVGYLPVPTGLRGWLRLVVPAGLWGMCALGALVGGSLESAGSGFWETGHSRVFQGVLTARPYPCLEVPDSAANSGTRSVLLVEPGKLGARPELMWMEGRIVRVEGFVLEREGKLMLELLPGAEGARMLDETGETDPTPSAPQSLGEAVLYGEIVDSKCWFGAMKPGDGVTHRACARLCVKGGIPPALIVHTKLGDRLYLLTDDQGGPMNDAVLDLIGRPVEVPGEIVRIGDQHLIRVSPGRVRLMP